MVTDVHEGAVDDRKMPDPSGRMVVVGGGGVVVGGGGVVVGGGGVVVGVGQSETATSTVLEIVPFPSV